MGGQLKASQDGEAVRDKAEAQQAGKVRQKTGLLHDLANMPKAEMRAKEIGFPAVASYCLSFWRDLPGLGPGIREDQHE